MSKRMTYKRLIALVNDALSRSGLNGLEAHSAERTYYTQDQYEKGAARINIRLKSPDNSYACTLFCMLRLFEFDQACPQFNAVTIVYYKGELPDSTIWPTRLNLDISRTVNDLHSGFHCNNKGLHITDPGYRDICDSQCASCAAWYPPDNIVDLKMSIK